MMHKINMLNSARDNGWKLVKTADVEIDGSEITDATLYEKDGVYMMVVRGESNYGPDEDYAEWDTDNYKEAITKFREFVVDHSKRKRGRRVNSARLNSAADNAVTLTLAYYDWRLVYTCLVYYEERLDLYNDSKYQSNYYDIINTMESALHGDWDRLNVNAEEDEPSEANLVDSKDVSIQFTVLESQLIYKAVYNMEDSLYDTGIFDDVDIQDCYDLHVYFESQLGMSDAEIIEATNVSANRRKVNSARLNSADQGFIKIGNKVIPTNTMDMGYADYDTVARRGREDYEAQERAKAEAAAKEEADRKEAELRANGPELYEKFENICSEFGFDDTNALDDKLNDLLVPASGAAETAAGEILRAVERIGYRFNNDGDYFYGGYGLETAGSSAAYLTAVCEGKIVDLITDAADHMMDWPGYDAFIEDLYKAVVNYLLENPELFSMSPEGDSRSFTDGILDKWKDEHTYEFEISLEDFRYGLDNGWISESDVEDYVSNLAQQYGASYNHPYRDYYTIIGLDPEDYGDLDRNYVNWIDEWMGDLELEHEEEEEYDEEEEE